MHRSLVCHLSWSLLQAEGVPFIHGVSESTSRNPADGGRLGKCYFDKRGTHL